MGVTGAAVVVDVACELANGVNSAGTAVPVGVRLGIGVGLVVGMRVATAAVAVGSRLSVEVRVAEAAMAVDGGPPVSEGSESHPTSITAISVSQTTTIDRFRFALIYFLIRYSLRYLVNDVWPPLPTGLCVFHYSVMAILTYLDFSQIRTSILGFLRILGDGGNSPATLEALEGSSL